MHTIKNRFLGLVSYHTGLRFNDLKMTDRLDEDLGLDSLDEVELIMYLEDQFGVRLCEDDEFDTLQQIYDAIIAEGAV